LASDDVYFPQSADKSMSDLLGYIGSNINFGIKLQGIQQTKKENLFYINHFKSPNDLYEITASEIEELLNNITHSDLYDFVIIDMGGYLDYKAIKLFECVDKIVLVDKNDGFGKTKMNMFMSQAHIINEYGYKIIRVLNFGMKSNNDYYEKTQLIDVVENIPSMDSEKVISLITERYMNRVGETIINS
jgi:MinD-like ATPase involved in chromosome partitioning or flagellar assembly